MNGAGRQEAINPGRGVPFRFTGTPACQGRAYPILPGPFIRQGRQWPSSKRLASYRRMEPQKRRPLRNVRSQLLIPVGSLGILPRRIAGDLVASDCRGMTSTDSSFGRQPAQRC